MSSLSVSSPLKPIALGNPVVGPSSFAPASHPFSQEEIDFFEAPIEKRVKPDVVIASPSDVSAIGGAVEDRGYALIGQPRDGFSPDGACRIPAALEGSFAELRQIYDKLQPPEGLAPTFITQRGTDSCTLIYDGSNFKLLETSLCHHKEIATNTFLQELIKTSLKMIPHASWENPADQRPAKIGVGLTCHRGPTTGDLRLHKDPGSFLFTYNIERAGIVGGEARISEPRPFPPDKEPLPLDFEGVFERPLEGYVIDQRGQQLRGSEHVCYRFHGAKKITAVAEGSLKLNVGVADDGSVKLDVIPPAPPARKLLIIQILDQG